MRTLSGGVPAGACMCRFLFLSAAAAWPKLENYASPPAACLVAAQCKLTRRAGATPSFFFLSPPIDPAAAATGQPSVGAWVDCQMGCRRNRRMRSAPLLPNGFRLCCGLRRRLHRSRRCARSSGERGRDGKKHGSGRTQGQAIAVSRQRAPPRSPARRSLYLVSAAPHRLSRLIALRFTPMRKASAGLEPALADTRTRSLSAACFIYFDRCTRSNSCSHGFCGRLQRLQQASAGFKRLLKTQIAGDYPSQHGRCGVPLV